MSVLQFDWQSPSLQVCPRVSSISPPVFSVIRPSFGAGPPIALTVTQPQFKSFSFPISVSQFFNVNPAVSFPQLPLFRFLSNNFLWQFPFPAPVFSVSTQAPSDSPSPIFQCQAAFPGNTSVLSIPPAFSVSPFLQRHPTSFHYQPPNFSMSILRCQSHGFRFPSHSSR